MAEPASDAGDPASRARVAWIAAGTAVLVVASWRTHRVSPLPGFDPSWTAGLHMAARHGLDWGDGLAYVYGPLGFLTVVRVFYESTALAAFAFVVAVQVALCAALLAVLTRRWPWWVAVPVAFVAAEASTAMVVTDALVGVAVVWALARLRRTDVSGRALRLHVVVAAGVAALALLTKVNSGVVVTGVVAVVALACRRPWSAMLSWLGVLVAGWTITGNPVGDLVAYLRNGAEVVSGHSRAMGLAERESSQVYAYAAAVGVVVAIAVWLATAGWERGRRVAAVLVVGVVVFGAFKHAFVRPDPPHLATFFATAVLVAAACAGARRNWVLPVSVVVLAVLFSAYDDWHPLGDVFDPVEHARWAGYQATTLAVPDHRRAVMHDARSSLHAHYAIDPAVLALVRGHTVHVEPWEAAAVWAYELDGDWRPVPVFQAAVAYTPRLDHLDARFLRSADAPERILRQTARASDGRHPAWESPAAIVAMLCRYRELSAVGDWQVLERVADRCGDERELGVQRVRAGEEVVVPAAGPGELVLARIDGIDSSLADRLRSLAWRAPAFHVVVNGATRYRLVAATAPDGLLLDVPDGFAYSPQFTLDPAVQRLTIDRGGELTVRFSAMSLQQ